MQSKEKPKLGKGPMTASEAVRIAKYVMADPIIGPMVQQMLSNAVLEMSACPNQ